MNGRCTRTSNARTRKRGGEGVFETGEPETQRKTTKKKTGVKGKTRKKKKKRRPSWAGVLLKRSKSTQKRPNLGKKRRGTRRDGGWRKRTEGGEGGFKGETRVLGPSGRESTHSAKSEGAPTTRQREKGRWPGKGKYWSRKREKQKHPQVWTLGQTLERGGGQGKPTGELSENKNRGNS